MNKFRPPSEWLFLVTLRAPTLKDKRAAIVQSGDVVRTAREFLASSFIGEQRNLFATGTYELTIEKCNDANE